MPIQSALIKVVTDVSWKSGRGNTGEVHVNTFLPPDYSVFFLKGAEQILLTPHNS